MTELDMVGIFEGARIAGMNYQTFRRAVDRGAIPCVRTTGKWRTRLLKRTDVAAFAEARKRTGATGQLSLMPRDDDGARS